MNYPVRLTPSRSPMGRILHPGEHRILGGSGSEDGGRIGTDYLNSWSLLYNR